MEAAIGLLVFGIGAFLTFKAALSFFRMWNPQDRLSGGTGNWRNRSSFSELLWPFSLFTSNSQENREARQHFWDFLLYSMLLFLLIVAFALVKVLLE